MKNMYILIYKYIKQIIELTGKLYFKKKKNYITLKLKGSPCNPESKKEILFRNYPKEIIKKVVSMIVIGICFSIFVFR